MNPASPAFEDLNGEEYKKKEKEFLSDLVVLWGSRWGIEFSFHVVDGITYVFGICAKFTIGDRTLKNALGLLQAHILYNRGGQHSTWEELVRYKTCKERWCVMEPVSESSSGDTASENQPGPSWAKKFKR